MAMEASQGQKPAMSMFGPEWWHHHGMKMRLAERHVQVGLMILKGSAAELKVAKARDREGWYVTWKVTHGQGHFSGGQFWMDDMQLGFAFGLADVVGSGSTWLVERFGATAAVQGSFIRWGRFLNIPCPGTGHDGDPNISIELDAEITETVRALIFHHSAR